MKNTTKNILVIAGFLISAGILIALVAILAGARPDDARKMLRNQKYIITDNQSSNKSNSTSNDWDNWDKDSDDWSDWDNDSDIDSDDDWIESDNDNTWDNWNEDKTDWKNTNMEDFDMNDLVTIDEFSNKEIKEMDITLEAAYVIFQEGQDFSLKTENTEINEVKCDLSANGRLRIDNRNRYSKSQRIFTTHDKDNIPRILITIPQNLNLNELSIEMGAGNFVAQDCSIKSETTHISIGAGQLILKKVNTNKLTTECGAGNLVFEGKVNSKAKIHCGFGNTEVKLMGNRADYDIDASVGLGAIRVNDEKLNGFGETKSKSDKGKELSIECGLGNVSVSIN